MAQDPERELDESSDFDMVTLFSSSNHDGEMEATSIHSVLEASGIPSVVVGPSVMPSLDFQVQVPQSYAEEAERVLDEARAAGPQAAAEAEAASEEL
jgi:imidazolonepropionase-like amidohydrolase